MISTGVSAYATADNTDNERNASMNAAAPDIPSRVNRIGEKIKRLSLKDYPPSQNAPSRNGYECQELCFGGFRSALFLEHHAKSPRGASLYMEVPRYDSAAVVDGHPFQR